MKSSKPVKATTRGRILKQLRESVELEQKDVADHLGVSRVTVSRWENAERVPSRSVVRELVAFYVSRGAELDPEDAAAAGVDLPKSATAGTSHSVGKDRPDTVRIPQEILRTAMLKTEEHLLRLSEISGYAKHVLEMMQAVTAGQARVVESLAPWVVHEEKAYEVDPQMLQDAEADVIRDAARESASKSESPRPRRQKSAGK